VYVLVGTSLSFVASARRASSLIEPTLADHSADQRAALLVYLCVQAHYSAQQIRQQLAMLAEQRACAAEAQARAAAVAAKKQQTVRLELTS
jgi:hypothetical protein